MQRLWKSTVISTQFLNSPRFLSHFPSTSSTHPNTNLNLRNNTNSHYAKFQITQSVSRQTPSSPIFSKTPQISSLISPHNPGLLDGEVDFLHAQAIKNGNVQYCNIYNHLLSLYVRQQNLQQARELFEEIPIRDVRSWTVLISGYAKMGMPEMALETFNEMQMEGVCPNHFTLSSVLKCCASVNSVRTGKMVHGWILRNEVELDTTLENSVIDAYVKCGVFDYAKRVFELMEDKNTVSWNIMIGAYLENGDTNVAVGFFRRLPFKDVASWNTIIIGLMRNGSKNAALELLYQMCLVGVVFNDNTYSIALLLAASLSALEIGRQIHCNLLRTGFHQKKFIRNSLINMYCKCGDMDTASKIFSRNLESPEREHTSAFSCDLTKTNISWSSIISGYVQNGRTEEAFEIFHKMVSNAAEVDPYTLTSIVAACADVGIPEWGRQVHAMIEKLGYKLDEFLVSTIIDMYAKCGSLHDAQSLFRQSNSKNIVLWTSMISGCALHGQGKEAIRLFQLMLEKGIMPNEISFIGVLSGCSHSGLVEEGKLLFRSMREDYGILPNVEHFSCMVDLLGRAGQLNEAKEFIYENNICHLSSVWRALLSACQIHKNIDLGKQASKQLHKIEPFNATSYVLLSNIYTTTHRWKEAAETRSLMQKRGFRKQPGQSWIRLKNQVHRFVVGDRSHPQSSGIYSYLERLIGKIKELGYSTNTDPIMHDVEEEQRDILLGFHSEKLAIAYGIMSTPDGSPILVMKNLRVCVDCHTAIKYISQVTGRQITVRDAHRFHHFNGGHCSCQDYW